MAKAIDTVSTLVRLGNVLLRVLSPVVERHGLTAQQWLVLAVIARADGPLSLADLGRRLSVSKQNMTGMISRLESTELVSRQADPEDLRAVRIGLTRRGRLVESRLRPEFEQWAATLLAKLSKSQSQALGSAAESLLESLESAD